MLRDRLFNRKNDIARPADQPLRQGPSRLWLRVGLMVIVIAAIIFALYRYVWPVSSAPVGETTVPVVQGDLAVNVSSSGTVKPSKSIDLTFENSGRVVEVFVKPNQAVTAGQPLARIDDQELRLQVQQAEADVQTAQAQVQQAQEGSATEQDLSAAQASVQSAQAALEKTRTGNITAADLREAEAAVRSARAQLDALRNPSADKVSAAQTALIQAQTGLQSARDNLSAAKSSAQLALERSTDDLTRAQSTYATAKWNWDYVNETGQDPTNPTVTGPDGKTRPNTLNDSQRQQYYDAFVQAEAGLRSAEKAVRQAQLDYDNARQAEVIGVQQAEAKVADAQQQFEALKNPSASAVVQAEASVQQAQARLDKLRQGGTKADVQAAEAQVQAAQANLEKLTAPAAASNISIAQAGLSQAQAKLDSAKSQLDKAVLTAPFSGTITAVNIIPGSLVSMGGGGGGDTAAISLADMSSMYIDVSLSESDVPRVTAGQIATITFDALPDKAFAGTVTSVASAATRQNNIVTYAVTIQFNPGTEQVKSGMTASVDITVDKRLNVIQVPNRAISTQGPISTVEVIYGEQKARATVQVQTGITNGTTTEIVSCTATNNQCLRPGDQVVLDSPGAAGGNAQGQNTLIQTGNGGAPAGPPQMQPLP